MRIVTYTDGIIMCCYTRKCGARDAKADHGGHKANELDVLIEHHTTLPA